MSNKNVFSCCLKAESVKPGSLMPAGRVFHDTGPDEQKARGPSMTVRVVGTRSWKPSAERRCDRPVTVESGTQNDAIIFLRVNFRPFSFFTRAKINPASEYGHTASTPIVLITTN